MPRRSSVVTPRLALVFLAEFAAMAGFYLLLSTVPQYAASVGAGGVGAGLATGALMLATVACELATPRLLAAFGYRAALAAGLLLLGLPALLLPAALHLGGILAICLVRGAGLAIMVVVGTALVADLVPAERLGEGMGLYGVIATVPAVLALPLGAWMTAHVGYRAVFAAGAAAPLLGLVALPALAPHTRAVAPPHSLRSTLRMPAVLRPALVFLLTAMTAGVVVSFAPLVARGAAAPAVSLALLAHGGATTAGRWWGGIYGDRRGAGRILVPASLACAAGLLALVAGSSPALVVGGAGLVGAGFGVAQSDSITVMMRRAPGSAADAVSALWNAFYDAGLGAGAAGFGALAARTGFPAGFVLAALVAAAATIAIGWRLSASPASPAPAA